MKVKAGHFFRSLCSITCILVTSRSQFGTHVNAPLIDGVKAWGFHPQGGTGGDLSEHVTDRPAGPGRFGWATRAERRDPPPLCYRRTRSWASWCARPCLPSPALPGFADRALRSRHRLAAPDRDRPAPRRPAPRCGVRGRTTGLLVGSPRSDGRVRVGHGHFQGRRFPAGG